MSARDDGQELLAQVMQDVLQEHLKEEVTSKGPSPESELQLSGRFTSRLRKAPATTTTWPQLRPGRLLGTVPETERSQAPCDATPALQHLALLEEAVMNGSELPPLCKLTGTVQPPPRHLAPRLHPAAPPPQSAAAGQMTTPRLLVTDGTWGLQAPDPAERRRPAALAAALGFRTSQLRGVGLARRGAGAAHTARWVSMEAQRLREEARHPKCLGASFATAFLVNKGPERMEPLSASLCAIAPIA
ncbi:unnamed protein product [Cladocopium goreaui]|uniref:Uncharacterized protein n=1 Tax=Cladocopium goreaui TaxID=2562237 RepID=A0A9P1DDP7_9DINO|nr:unnamed protein product [Cladocopium goreaui]|mmetsp:Transcript_24063/g.52387  ORF Transcript_24063/g.52387 Transcript_24063/m.52387 type:complete len:245 (-) Transcript_24063:31-765(-)